MPERFRLRPEHTRLLQTVLDIFVRVLTTVLKLHSTITPRNPAFVNAELVADILVESLLIGTFEGDGGLGREAWNVVVGESGRAIHWDVNLSRDTVCSFYAVTATPISRCTIFETTLILLLCALEEAGCLSATH